MPRIRNIKPDFWTDEKLVELSPWARLLFVGLWNFADDEGYMPYSPRKIKMQVFPADALEISVLLNALLKARLIELFDSEEGRVLHISHWDRHQKVSNPTASKIARFDLVPVPLEESITELSVPVHTEGEREGERNRVVPFRTEVSPVAIDQNAANRLVNWWLDSTPSKQRPPSSIVAHASIQIEALIREGFPEAQIQDGLREWWSGKYPPSTIPNYVARAGQTKMATGSSRALQTLQIDVSGIEP